MSVWYCECHGLHGPMAQCVKASRATFTNATGLGGRVSEAPAREAGEASLTEGGPTVHPNAGDSVAPPASALSPEAERRHTVYISGPMTGYPDFNYPAFADAAKRIRAAGFQVLSPAENFGGDQTKTRAEYMRADLEMVMRADALALLPGWVKSQGARLEVMMARELGLSFSDVANECPLSDEEVDRLLRSPVASTTLPREPSEAALEAAFIAERDYGVSLDPAVTGTTMDRLRFGLRAAYAVDGSPVASLAPTEVRAFANAIMGWYHETKPVCPNDTAPNINHDVLGCGLCCESIARWMLPRFAVSSSLAPTSLAECDERKIWDEAETLLFRWVSIMSDVSEETLIHELGAVHADTRAWGIRLNMAKRAAEAARPPKGA